MKKIITLSNHARKCLLAQAFGYACRLALQKKMLFTVILLTNVLIASFSQKSSDPTISFKVEGSPAPFIVRDKTIGGLIGDDKLHSGISTPDGGYLFSGTSLALAGGDK